MQKMLVLLVAVAVVLTAGWALATQNVFRTGAPEVSESIAVPFNDGQNNIPPILVVDSTLFVDNMEGGFPAWTSVDIHFDPATRWHLEGFHAFGGSGNAFRCSDPAVACPNENGGYDNHWLQYLEFNAVNLAGTTNPQFSVSADWAIEAPGGEPAGYDMWDGWNAWVSVNNGVTWSVLAPSSPAYTGQSSYAFGEEWGMGTGIGAYGGVSGGHTLCTFPLNAYIGQTNVKVRVAFCSDPAFSSVDACATTWGVVIDNVLITDGANTLYSNNGVPGGWQGFPGPESPNTWSYDAAESHSPTHSYRGAQTALYVNRTLTSYPVTLPAGYQKLKMAYWVWADLPDSDGDDDGGLDDYYRIMVSTDNGATWVQAAYDYAYDNGEGNSAAGWVRRTRGLASGGLQMIDIPLITRADATNPVTVRVGIELSLDGNNDGGSGTGLHIDDVEFIAQRAQQLDAATSNLIVYQPNTVGIPRPWSFLYSNEGLQGISPLRYNYMFTRPNSTSTIDSVGLLSGVLNYGESTTVTMNNATPTRPLVFNPDMAGGWRMRIRSNLPNEQDRTNDTTYSPTLNVNQDRTLGIIVRPAGLYELGYGRRTYANAYLQERFQHFTPAADAVPAPDAANYDILQLRVMWRYEPLAVNGATTRIRFYNEGPNPEQVGSLFYEIVTDIDSTETTTPDVPIRWWTLNLSGINQFRNRSGNFWVAIAAQDTLGPNSDPAPLPLGTSLAALSGDPDGHNYFGTAGQPLTQSAGRLLINAVIGQAVEDVVANRQAYPSNDVRLTWTASPGATRYYVWRLANSEQPYNTGTLLTPGGITTTTFTDTGVVGNPAVRFFYTVVTEY